ncbi:MAG: ATP-dependent DNA ligase [Bacteroidia bacterium]|nr:ATP-dependent DNA ligase [Bacteroidia bacterium]
MKDFVALFQSLDQTTKTNEKLALLKQYFLSAPDQDKIWALALFTGRRPPRPFKTSQIQEWALEVAGIPEWLFKESYHSVGDLSETISLILPPSNPEIAKTLSEWFDWLKELKGKQENEVQKQIQWAWTQLNGFEIFVFNKLMMGSFRIGVSQTLVIRAIAEAYQLDVSGLTHQLMGNWDPYTTSFADLLSNESSQNRDSKPYPFYLAFGLENPVEQLGHPDDWFVEWKWDGIRSQIIVRNQEIYIWTRGEELVTDKFPELNFLKETLPHGTVLDGEILAISEKDHPNWKPLSFNILQKRIGRKSLSKKFLQEYPVGLMIYDILEWEGKDIRQQSHHLRRSQLEQLASELQSRPTIKLSETIPFNTWHELEELQPKARLFDAEGFMLKRKTASYQVGRKKGDWWKWKVNPFTIDAVLIYAQKGHGRRADIFSDYTLAVWDQDKLVTFAKAYSGLSDAELLEIDRFIKQNTLEKFGPVRTVRPELVFEIGFEGIQQSSRHKSGIAVRFPRIMRWRRDKTASEADSLDNLKNLLKSEIGHDQG